MDLALVVSTGSATVLRSSSFAQIQGIRLPSVISLPSLFQIPNSQLFHSFVSPRPTLLLPSSRRTRCCHHLDSSPEPRRRLCRIRLAIYPHHYHPFRHSGSPFSPVMMATIVGGQSFSCPRGTSGGPLAPDGENLELLGIWLRTLAASPCVAFSKLASDDEMEHACFSGGPHMFGSAVCCAARVCGAPHDGAGRVHKFSYGTDIFFCDGESTGCWRGVLSGAQKWWVPSSLPLFFRTSRMHWVLLQEICLVLNTDLIQTV
jgi:hypothetical protein